MTEPLTAIQVLEKKHKALESAYNDLHAKCEEQNKLINALSTENKTLRDGNVKLRAKIIELRTQHEPGYNPYTDQIVLDPQ